MPDTIYRWDSIIRVGLAEFDVKLASGFSKSSWNDASSLDPSSPVALKAVTWILFFRFRLPAIYEMELDIKVQLGVPHIFARSNHGKLRLFIGKSKDACKERDADRFNTVKALSKEIHSNFFQFGIFWPATKGNLLVTPNISPKAEDKQPQLKISEQIPYEHHLSHPQTLHQS